MNYLKILRSYVAMNLKYDVEYRASNFASTLANLSWTNFSLFSVLIVGHATGGIGGWNIDQMVLLSGLWMIYNSLSHTLWYGNMKRTIVDVHSGRLDLLLVKPVDAQFHTSIKRIISNSLFGLFEGAIVCMWSVHNLGISLTPLHVLLAILLITFGLIVYYSLWMMTATLGFHFAYIENAPNLVPELADFSKYPIDAYTPSMQAMAYGLIPIMIITFFPATALLDRIEVGNIMYFALATLVLFVVARLFWNYSIKKYTSAN